MFYLVTIVMKTFSIQLVFTYICLSNANYYGENDVKVQRQMPFEPKNDTTWDGIMNFWNKTLWSNQTFEQREYASPEHGIMDSWIKTFGSNQNFDHGDYAPRARARTRLRTKSSRFCNPRLLSLVAKIVFVKFMYSEKATKFCEITHSEFRPSTKKVCSSDVMHSQIAFLS